jgi:TonB family protein
MRGLIGVLLFFVTTLQWSYAQNEALGDTTVYTVAEEQPRFPGCEALDTTLVVKQQCAQQQLLAFVYNNLSYPAEAIRNDNEGTVVVSFVVEKDGTISDPEILRNVAGGCGEEALRVVQLMNPSGIRWTPGKSGGMAVRTKFNLPIRFRLSDAQPFQIVGRDSIWTLIDEPAQFKGGPETLQAYLDTEVDYPPSGIDSCMVGNIIVQVVVRRDGDVKVINMEDNSNLGVDFWWEAIQTIHASSGRWQPAVFKGEAVPAAYNILVPFRPAAPSCRQVAGDYEKALMLANEGAGLFNEGKTDEGIAKLSEAIELAPRDANIRYIRGQAYVELKQFALACEDFNAAREIAPLAIFDNVLPFLCK